MNFDGKVALVTGGAAGIGEATSLRFAAEGAAVMVADINGAGAKAVAEKIKREGGKAQFFQGDLTVPETAERMVAATLQAFGRMDCAFNNVGGAVRGSEFAVHEVPLDILDADLKLSMYTTLYSLRAEIPHFLTRGSGAIVNTSSLVGLGGTATNATYAMSKHAVIGLTKHAAIAYGPKGIRVNAICPGSIDTPALELNFAGNPDWRQLLSHAALERIGQPQEVANLVVWLCSDEASFLTGAAIPIDGGTSAFAVRVAPALRKN
jgi:NAD(P)-dependent dehydrogenase (short-subunit alcohol dehydrogenase family)